MYIFVLKRKQLINQKKSLKLARHIPGLLEKMKSSSRLSIARADKISNLPDSILCHILSFISTKQAAITSVLSKRWRPLWRSVLALNFNSNDFKTFVRFVRVINSTMKQRDITEPIQSFRLKCPKYSSFDQKNLNQFVKFVLQRGIQNFYLHLPETCKIQTKLPHNILCCRTLEVLKLKSIMMVDFSHLVDIDLPCVKTLHLSRVYFGCHEHVMKLLSSCPIIEDLKTKCLHAPDGNERHPLEEKFRSFPNLFKARICDLSILISMVSTCVTQLPMFQSLTYLELNFRDQDWFLRGLWLLEVLKHSPKLQNLTIQECERLDSMYKTIWMDPPSAPECLSTWLKTCCIRGYRGTKYEFEFAKYIMQHSKVLETMTIKSTCLEKYQMSLKLSSCSRGSTTCKLLFD
ncbi:putative F-box domain, FBD domain, leucine-rich repeat domain, L domain-containing protein [Medicago truncatula]|uniref:Putative F-box domain, FBD domain, leucine-rich repeat domain, L domain-containing protein n=1 Tax=Medicago truncatula TaxID=3880 RepID=A0A396ILY5_MEDTR|nr:putative F-box domain, FBD domain, leucine-rich repeat domain, L domain-containing protein [Medicago truncatula]